MKPHVLSAMSLCISAVSRSLWQDWKNAREFPRIYPKTQTALLRNGCISAVADRYSRPDRWKLHITPTETKSSDDFPSNLSKSIALVSQLGFAFIMKKEG